MLGIQRQGMERKRTLVKFKDKEHFPTASKALKEERIKGKNEHTERYQQLH